MNSKYSRAGNFFSSLNGSKKIFEKVRPLKKASQAGVTATMFRTLVVNSAEEMLLQMSRPVDELAAEEVMMKLIGEIMRGEV